MKKVVWREPVSTNPDREEHLSRDADWHNGPIPTVRVVARTEAYVPGRRVPLWAREHGDLRRAPKLSAERRAQIARELADTPPEGRLLLRTGILQAFALRHEVSVSCIYKIGLRVAAREEAAA